jgi:hypothetical protein
MTVTMRRRFWKKEEAPEYVEGDSYSARELELIADDILRGDGKREMCRECGEEGLKTDKFKVDPQFERDDDGNIIQALEDGEGNQLYLRFHLLTCPQGHEWYEGEGKSKGFKGDNPILFEEHLLQRKRREIYCEHGTPDPEIVSGSYNRVHPNGRRQNTQESRKKHGASFYS